jgi:uncharacterized RDD family membrane protein YckC
VDPALYRGVLWRRVLAFLLDACLVFLIWLGVWTIVGVLGLLSLGLLMPILWPLTWLVAPAYHALTIASPVSATPGQMALGLLVRSEPGGGRPSPLQALAMTLLFYLTWVTFGLLLLAALFSARGRTLHDFFAGVVVVRAAAFAGRTRPRIGG